MFQLNFRLGWKRLGLQNLFNFGKYMFTMICKIKLISRLLKIPGLNYKSLQIGKKMGVRIGLNPNV